ncbi:MAG: rod shape-determining protein MreC [Coriobacteriia bacterium]|nr:rod shape-determining protein MreC [Coriobacteriia bacterium]MBS5477816.1 rod shape-determining protein MreC [Coriobacteriia bacterium]
MARLKPPIGEPDAPSGALRLLVALCVVSVVIVTLYFREGPSGPVHVLRSAAQTVAAPFSWAGSQLARPFVALGNVVRNATADSATLSELELENAGLRQQLAQMTEYEQENARLEELLDLTSAYGMRGKAARVIGRSTDSWNDTITIDKGATDGVRLDMPVTCGTGVVGQVTSVAATSATVRLISDPQSGISAMLQSSRASGVVSGSVDGTLRLQYVDSSVSVTVGELVVTSGLGGVYPKGLPLGTVTSVTTNPSDLYHEITIDPAAGGSASVPSYEEVFVVMSFDEATADAQAEQVLAGQTADTDTADEPATDAAAGDATDAGAEGGEAQ